MKICGKCGAQVEDGLKFCGGCGSPMDTADAVPQQTYNADPNQQYNQQYNNFQQQPAAPKQPNPLIEKVKKQPVLLAIPAGALVAVIVLIVVLINVTSYQKIDAEKLFIYDFQGINKYGTVDIELGAYDDYIYKEFDKEIGKSYKVGDVKGIDDEDFAEDIEALEDEEKDHISPYLSVVPKTLKENWNKPKTYADLSKYRKVLLKTNSKGKYLIKAKADKEKNLSNGDKIKVTVTYDKELLKKNKIKLTNTSFTIEVKNLEEGVEFDPFDEKYLSVTFDGMDGEGKVNANSTADTPYNVYYDTDKYSGLSNGEKVTVTAEIGGLTEAGKAYYFENDGKYFIVENKDNLTKEFEVSGLTELKEIDVFENIEFEYERGTPFLRVNGVNNDNMDKIVVDNVSFYVEDADSLKVGDKFKVKAYSYSLSNEGYKVKGEPDSDGYYVKEFTVGDDMPAYVTADNGTDAYNSADFKSIIEDQESNLKSTLQGSSAGGLWYETGVEFDGRVEKVESLTLKDVYVGFTDKNNYSNVNDYVNRLYGLYEIKVKTDDEENSSATLYGLIYMDNVLSSDGKYYQNSSWDSCNTYFYGTMNDFNKEVVGKEGYTVTKCGGGATPDVDDSKPEETTTTTAKPEEESKPEETKEETETEKAEEKTEEETEKAS